MSYKLIALGLTALAFISMASYIYILRADIKGLKTEITGLEKYLEQSEKEVAQCVSDKALTERISNEYSASLAALRRDRDRLRNNPQCVLPKPSGQTGVSSGTGTKLLGENGIRIDWLYDFAGDAEQDRLTAIGCLAFVDALYASRVNE